MERNKVVVQIVAMMLLIFAAGGWAGWTLGRSQVPLPSSQGAGRPRQPNPDRLLREFKQQLNLTAEQQTKLEPLLSEWSKAATAVEQGRLKERRELLRKYAPVIRTYLTPEQQTQYDRMTRRVETFQERRIGP